MSETSTEVDTSETLVGWGPYLVSLVDVALEALGTTVEEVAAELLKGGFKGVPRRACECPVALYLSHALNVPTDSVAVAFSDAVLMWGNSGPISIPLPGAVSQFVNDFDKGLYRELRDDE